MIPNENVRLPILSHATTAFVDDLAKIADLNDLSELTQHDWFPS